MLKLKLQYFGHFMWRTDSLEKTLMLGKIEGRRRRGRQRMRWLDGITDLMDMSWSKLGVDDGQGGLLAAIHGVAKNRTWLSDWTDWLTKAFGDFPTPPLAGVTFGGWEQNRFSKTNRCPPACPSQCPWVLSISLASLLGWDHLHEICVLCMHRILPGQLCSKLVAVVLFGVRGWGERRGLCIFYASTLGFPLSAPSSCCIQ